jgi:hypothetical protein
VQRELAQEPLDAIHQKRTLRLRHAHALVRTG